MTQIRKAFEDAALDAALRNFTKTYTQNLESAAAQTLTDELNKLDFPLVKANTIRKLHPKETFTHFLAQVERAMEQLFNDACLKTYAATYNSTFGNVYNKALERITAEVFRPIEAECLDTYLKKHDGPKALYHTAEKIFEAYYAQVLLSRLISETATPRQAKKEFTQLFDELSADTQEKTMLTMLELSTKNSNTLYMSSLTKYIFTRLLLVYKVKNDEQKSLNNVNKQVLSAYIIR